MVLYFSGTGNSEYAAKMTAEILEDTAVSITEKIKKRNAKEISSQTPLVFVTPTYGWRIPRVVEEWIEKVPFSGNKNVYFLMTCGGSIGNSEKYIRKLCKKKGFTFMGCQEIVMPENYIAMFPVPGEEEARSIVRKAEAVIRRTAETIKAGKVLESKKISLADHMSSSIVNNVFYAFFVRDGKFYATDECVGCSKCARVCPLNNIKITDGRPVWNKKCTHCMACISSCPKEAIEYGKASKGKPRYRCPM